MIKVVEKKSTTAKVYSSILKFVRLNWKSLYDYSILRTTTYGSALRMDHTTIRWNLRFSQSLGLPCGCQGILHDAMHRDLL
jgi:hypothetical protein